MVVTESHTACGGLSCLYESIFCVMAADVLELGPNPEVRAHWSDIENFDLVVIG